MKYLSIGKFAKEIGVTTQTLRNWDKEGRLKPHHVADTGYRYYSQQQLNNYLGFSNTVKPDRKVIGYCRVSSYKQKKDLERQIENMELYLTAKGKPFEIISDIGSGINYNKKGLQTLMNKVYSGEVEKIVIMYKDRLLRFGLELIEFIAEKNNCTIEVVNSSEKTDEEELVEDLIQIVTVFSGRLHGKRSGKTRKQVERLIKDG